MSDPNPLLRALSAVEDAVDHSVARVRRRFDLWDDLHVLPYHGYGEAGGRVRLMGRVLDDPEVDDEADLSTAESAVLTARRFLSDEVPGARLRLTLGDATVEATSDKDGFYDVELAADLPADGLWHEATVTLLDPAPDEGATVTQKVQAPTAAARFLLISDLDDTVLVTGATNKLTFARRVLFNNATTRTVFPGVGAFYQALADEDGALANPVFYLSSSPWNLYRQFTGALRHRGVPPGTVFLKNFGIERDTFIKSGHGEHKLAHIERVLAFYPDLPAVLVGDSGQEDPEIYQQAVARHPGRVAAVFIRDVTDDARDAAVDQIARDVRARGVPFHRVETTVEAAELASELGLLETGEIDAVREAFEREREDGA